MAIVITNEQNYINIANAIREKTGSADTFRPDEMDNAILNIPSGGVIVGTLSVSENGTYNAPSGHAYDVVIVAVPVPTMDTLSVTDNGTYNAPSGHAYNSVIVAIPTASGVSF